MPVRHVRQVRRLRRTTALLALVAVLAGLGFASSPTAGAASRWAAAATAPIHPGVRTTSPVGSCSANFVFFRGEDVFLGQAAHCTSQGQATDLDGCRTGSLPLGTQVRVAGATRPAVMVYNSWLAMQAAGERDPNACAANDFALLRIDPADRARVNPTVPHWGGPTGINKTGFGDGGGAVYSFGDSSLRQGIPLLRPRSGLSLGTFADGWAHEGGTFLPGIPGDSGSAVLDGNGLAVGILTTLNVGVPSGITNGYGDFHRSFQYARNHGMPGLLLALGTRPFNPNQLPLG